MESREAVLGFHYAERAKSQLILAQRLMEASLGLSGEEGQAATRLLLTFYDGIKGDLASAMSNFAHIQWERAVQYLDRMKEETEVGDIQGAMESLSRCISAVTTISQLTMGTLLDRGIL